MSENERRLASEARHGGRVLTSNLCHYLLPRDNPSALVIQEAMASATAEKWSGLWRSHFDPAGGLEEYAAWMSLGSDDTEDCLPLDAVSWPIYRAAFA